MPNSFVITTSVFNQNLDAFSDTDASDNLFLLAGVSLLSGSAAGIRSTGGDMFMTLGGIVHGTEGIVLSGGLDDVTILAGGQVSGTFDAIVNTGVQFALRNFGSIFGNKGVVSDDLTRITNFGTIDSRLTGVELRGSSTIMNHGTLSSGSTAIECFDQLDLNNTGLISGNIALALSDKGDQVVNSGTIIGAVFMGGGDELLDSADGRIIGRVDLGAGNDTFLGGDAADDVTGGTGADMIDLGGGNDLLRLRAADGEDVLDGGAGIDMLFASGTGGLRVDLAMGYVRSGGETDLITGFEQVIGSDLADLLVGDAGANMLNGASGNDRLDGADGNDRLFGSLGDDVILGGTGNDSLHGEEGVDLLQGGDGDDVLAGGVDADRLTGGAGADRFDFNRPDEYNAFVGSGLDRITDFQQGQDVIDLSTLDALVNVAGNQAFAFRGSSAITDFGQISFRIVGAFTIVSFSVNGPGTTDILRLDGAMTLTAADFLL